MTERMTEEKAKGIIKEASVIIDIESDELIEAVFALIQARMFLEGMEQEREKSKKLVEAVEWHSRSFGIHSHMDSLCSECRVIKALSEYKGDKSEGVREK